MGFLLLSLSAVALTPLVRPPVVAVSAPRGEAAAVQIYDISGRRVVSRLSVDHRSGIVDWDGLDDRGRPVSAGVYWARPAQAASVARNDAPWSRCTTDPALDLGDPGCFDSAEVFAPTAVRDGDTLKVWYSGFDGTPDGAQRIGFTWSLDSGASWNRSCTPALSEGPAGSFDAVAVTAPHVHFDPDGALVLYFAGFDGAVYRIGRAVTSDGGRSWVRNPTVAVFSGQTSWSDFAAYKAVRYDDGLFTMLFVGLKPSSDEEGQETQPWKIGRAVSADGVFWTTSPSGPVYEGQGDWEWFGTTTLDLLRDGDEWVMWYSGTDADTLRIGAARSSDGINWSANPGNPILGVGPRDLWDGRDVNEPAALLDEEELLLFHSGRDTASVSTNGCKTQLASSIAGGIPAAISVAHLLPPAPNPFNPRTTLFFTLERAEELNLSIYNISGQRVIALVSGRMAAGRHAIGWDGRDERGRPVASGLYLAVMNTATVRETRKLVLLK
jgi:hypothetical protein